MFWLAKTAAGCFDCALNFEFLSGLFSLVAIMPEAHCHRLAALQALSRCLSRTQAKASVQCTVTLSTVLVRDFAHSPTSHHGYGFYLSSAGSAVSRLCRAIKRFFTRYELSHRRPSLRLVFVPPVFFSLQGLYSCRSLSPECLANRI